MSKIVKTCKECGEPFELSEAEVKWYEDRDLMPPERCKGCRAKRKAARQAKQAKEAKK